MIGATTYSAVVIMAIVTTHVTPPLLKWMLADRKAPRGMKAIDDGLRLALSL